MIPLILPVVRKSAGISRLRLAKQDHTPLSKHRPAAEHRSAFSSACSSWLSLDFLRSLGAHIVPPSNYAKLSVQSITGKLDIVSATKLHLPDPINTGWARISAQVQIGEAQSQILQLTKASCATEAHGARFRQGRPSAGIRISHATYAGSCRLATLVLPAQQEETAQ
jgi:hypothetical protein